MSLIKPPRNANWIVLLVQVPGSLPKPAGILLLDMATDQLHIALASGIGVCDEEIKEVWDCLSEDLAEKAAEVGGARLLESLEEDLSHFLQIEGPRRSISTADPEQTLATLFSEHVLGHSA